MHFDFRQLTYNWWLQIEDCLVKCLPNGWASSLLFQNAVRRFLYHAIVVCGGSVGSCLPHTPPESEGSIHPQQ